MDHHFDEAIRSLAELQLKHGMHSILLSVQGAGGDVLASVVHSPGHPITPYARVDRTTKTVVRLRMPGK